MVNPGLHGQYGQHGLRQPAAALPRQPCCRRSLLMNKEHPPLPPTREHHGETVPWTIRRPAGWPPETWTAAACCRFSKAALLPSASPGHRRNLSAAADAVAPQRDITLEGSTASRLASRKRQQAAAVHVLRRSAPPEIKKAQEPRNHNSRAFFISGGAPHPRPRMDRRDGLSGWNVAFNSHKKQWTYHVQVKHNRLSHRHSMP